ncbi:aKG-HExxH-type peptide beta-hydroxylase [Actinoplanes siamensis]|uniref:HEXXH motif domain-containing protein n=1 Tax=Actinoplanes siamensis TaxID=1223317 RepID=A0A919TKS7_9ACTN|nr:HEXXH motif-containing putative peptide modification protein [Actinoplanes siamensis]GIF05470.1 HEXXH motif domain-containing protein [Actinoplanes siamensis]
MTPHRIPDHLLRSLAAGHGGPEAIAALAAVQLSRNRLLARVVVELAHRAGHPETPAARWAYRLLAEIEQAAPEVVADLLRYPTVSVWLRTTTAALWRPGPVPAVRPGRLAAIAAAAAVLARVAVRFPPGTVGGGRTLVLPSLGQAVLPGDQEPMEVRPENRSVTLIRGPRRLPVDPDRESPGWTPLPRLSPGGATIRLDGAGWRLVPGGGPDRRIVPAVEPAAWLRRLADGYRLLGEHHRPVAAETAAAVRAVVPLRTPDSSLVSGTFRDGFGAVALSLPDDARLTALTFAHEVQHNKLVGVMDALPLTVPGETALFYAPWRDDPRPLGALLHGTYAHLGVAAFWQRQRLVEKTEEEAGAAQVAFARWRTAAWEATEVVLGTGRLTAVGHLMLAGMRETLRELLAEPVPPAAQRRADQLAARHRRRRAGR